MTLEFVVITTGRFGSTECTLIITEALHAKVPHIFGCSWYFPMYLEISLLNLSSELSPYTTGIPIIITVIDYPVVKITRD